MDILKNIAVQTWAMIAEMGPYLLLGFAISALLHRYLKQAWIERLMGQPKLSSVLWGSVVGVPMPLCSCGVIPVTMSLHSKGASKGATVSFLTSTPQTGVDSFLATYGMLGPVFAFYKIVVSFLSGILVGLVTEWSEPRTSKTSTPAVPPASKKTEAQPRFGDSLRYAFYTMPGDLAGSLLVGFVLAGLIAALAPADLLSNLPGGALSAILVATVISVPFYICSTGSIPLALALVQSGLPVSAALVLLVAGPATNVATITTMRKVLGGKTTVIYVAGVVLSAWLAAAAYHFFLDNGSFSQHAMNHEMGLPWWKHAGGIALLAVLLIPYLRETFFTGHRHSAPAASNSDPLMKTATLAIEGMNCSHCENSVRNGLASLPGLTVLSVDKSTSSAQVQAETLDAPSIEEKIKALGFTFKGIR